jgi:uncharacterized membrane protein (DUF106 family)
MFGTVFQDHLLVALIFSFPMKHALRFIVVAMIFATTGLFAQAATETTADVSSPQKTAKVVKKLAKKHRKHKKQKAQ